MCWMCDSSSKGVAAQGYVNQLLGISADHYEGKGETSFYDGSPTFKSAPLSQALLVVTADDAGDTVNSARALDVGATVVATIDTIGDQDFYKVELEAGRMYEISHFLKVAGPSGIPLADAYIDLYGPDGNLISNADAGGPNTPNGLDALLVFTPKVSGTYYVNARAFDQAPENGTTGDFVGDYQLAVRDMTGSVDISYKPYYDIDSPLHSIDWGTQVDRTSRNPDGQEGPRPTGNPFSGSSNIFGIEGKNVITVYFAKTGDLFVAEDPTNPGITATMVAKGLQPWEKAAFQEALKVYEQVADVVFVEVPTREEADFKIITYNGTPGVGASLLGRMSAPNTNNEGQTEFNAGDSRWTEEGLQKGGFYFPTLLHEFGHGMGLAHPHDNGGYSSVMRGAGTGTTDVIGGGYGDFDLSQQVFTIMSYNDGWASSPYGQARSGGVTGLEVDHFGWLASLSPLDIAVIQDKYGVNEEWATGDNVYTLKDVNAAGTYFEAIWDAGGLDQIVYDGARDSVIDLRAATLKYEEGGGGRVSYAFGIHGGFTIANGVTVENARTGSGNDKLIGNDANNKLESGAGNDMLSGGAGDDILVGGLGRDSLTGGSGNDVFLFTATGDSAAGSERDVITDFARGEDKIDLTGLGAKGFIAEGAFSGRAGEVRATSTNGVTVVELDVDGDRNADFQIELANVAGLSSGDFIDLAAGFEPKDGKMAALSGRATNDLLVATTDPDGSNIQGGAGNDTLLGGQFGDMLSGGLGDDALTGKGGSDQFRFFGTQIEGASDTDTITDLNFAEGDTITLGSFGAGTFQRASGVSAFNNGSSAIIDSWSDIAAIDMASNLVSTGSSGANGQDLLLRIVDGDGQVQNIVIQGGYAQYLSATSSGSMGGAGSFGGNEFAYNAF